MPKFKIYCNFLYFVVLRHTIEETRKPSELFSFAWWIKSAFSQIRCCRFLNNAFSNDTFVMTVIYFVCIFNLQVLKQLVRGRSLNSLNIYLWQFLDRSYKFSTFLLVHKTKKSYVCHFNVICENFDCWLTLKEVAMVKLTNSRIIKVNSRVLHYFWQLKTL